MIWPIASSCSATRSGVNALLTSAFIRSWRGGSIEIICRRWTSSGTPMSSTWRIPLRSEEKTLKSRVSARTSSWRVIDQNPPSSGSALCGLKCAGASRCIAANSSQGGPSSQTE